MPERMWERGPDGEIRRRPPGGPTGPSRRAGLTAGDPGTSSPGEGEAPLGPRGRPGRAIWRGLRDSYEHLWGVVSASVVWVLVLGTLLAGALDGPRRLLPGTGALALSAIGLVAMIVLVGGPLTAGLYRFARNACAHDEPELLDLLWGFRSSFGSAARLGVSQAVITAMLAGDAAFFFTRGSMFGAVAGVVFGYLLGFWALMALYQWPLLVEQQIGALAALKKSALLVLDNLPASILIGLAALGLTLLTWGFLLPAVVLWPGMMAFLQTRALRELLPRYGLLPVEFDPDPEEETSGGGWHE